MAEGEPIKMGRRSKEIKDDLKAWLLDFEDKVGKAVVVSLLVQDGKIEFHSCIDKHRLLNDDHDEDEATIDLASLKKGNPYSLSPGDRKTYIG